MHKEDEVYVDDMIIESKQSDGHVSTVRSSSSNSENATRV